MWFLFRCVLFWRFLNNCRELHQVYCLTFELNWRCKDSGLLCCCCFLTFWETLLGLYLRIDWVYYLLSGIHRHNKLISEIGVLFHKGSFSPCLYLILNWSKIIQPRCTFWTPYTCGDLGGLIQHFASYLFGLLWLFGLDLNLRWRTGAVLKSSTGLSHTKLSFITLLLSLLF